MLSQLWSIMGRFGLTRDERGAVSTEYVVLVGTVGIIFVLGLVLLGPLLVENYTATRSIIASPFP